jgi:germination protein M
MRRLRAGLSCVAMLWVVAACAGPAGERATADPAATTTARTARPRAATTHKRRPAQLSGRQLSLAVYYLRIFGGRRYLAPEWHLVPYTRAVAAAAVGELLGGQPLAPGSRRPFPAGTRVRSVQVQAGTAVVELSRNAFPAVPDAERRWPLQALVHTVTQFPTVKRVQVKVEGQVPAAPLVRDPALALAPIALMEPASGALVEGDRLVVRGEASVYEGTVSLRLRDDRGRVMAQSYATAARGAPGRGSFAGALTFTPPATPHCWTLEAFEVSPVDGEVTYAVQLPVWVGR